MNLNNKSHYIGLGLLFLSVVVYHSRPIYDECDYYLEQPLRIFSLGISKFCQDIIVMNITLLFLIISGIGFLLYWIIVGRIESPHLILSTAKREKRKLKAKIIATIAVATSGVLFMLVGITVFVIEPHRITYSDHNAELDLPDGQKAEIRLEFNALNGLMPFRGIDAKAKVVFFEKISNSSIVELKLPEGGVIVGPESGVLKAGKTVVLNFIESESDSKSSTYSREFYLQYDNPGKYDAFISIENDNTNFNDTLKTVVTIGSWNEYLALQGSYQAQGLAWLIFGLSLILVSPALHKFVNLYYKYFELKRNEFYE